MAIQALNGFVVEGKRLRVELQQPRAMSKPYSYVA